MCRCGWVRGAARLTRALPLLGLALAAGVAVPAGAATQDSSPPMLYLEVILNGAPTGLIAAFVERPSGALAVAPGELAEIGIRPHPEAASADGNVDLAALPGLSYEYDAAAQVIRIDAALDLLLPHFLDGGGGGRAPAGAFQSGTGAVMNYALYAGLMPSGEAVFSGQIDARFYAPIGHFTLSAIATAGASPGLLRLDTSFARSDPARLLTYRAGDLISGGLAWTRPVRLGGVQVAQRFALRPDLITMPVPAFSGSAAVPSTLDVYADGTLLFSDEVPAGPFVLSNLPIVSGAGTARVVLTDALGRTTEVNLPFFASPALLRKGLFHFSVEAGFPRRSYGVLSNDYAPDPAASASARYGLTDRLTVEAHAEATAGLVNGGVGLQSLLGTHGVGALAVAGSAGSHDGALVNANLDLRLGRASLRARILRAFGDYADTASVSADSPAPGDGAPRRIEQLGLSLPLGGRAAATLSYARVETAGGDRHEIAAVSFARRFPNNISLYAHAFHALDGSRGTGMYLGLSRPLGENAYGAASLRNDPDATTAAIDVVRSENATPGSYGWRLRAAMGSRTDILASASYRTSAARLAARAQTIDGAWSAGAEAVGAVAIAEKDIFFSNRIDDAFAIVDAGAPGVAVFAENRPAGRTNGRGRLLVAGLRSFEPNSLSIDPSDLPLDMEPERTKIVVVPAERAGVFVDFGVASNANAARVVFRDAGGAYLPPGLTGRTANGTEFVIGYDGEAYIQDLAENNEAVVTLENGAACTAIFRFTPIAGVQNVVDAGRCA